MMIENRLAECFSSVFPAVDESRIPTLSMASLPEWDSLATVTLIALIEEEFDVQVSGNQDAEFTSFALIADYLKNVSHAA